MFCVIGQVVFILSCIAVTIFSWSFFYRTLRAVNFIHREFKETYTDEYSSVSSFDVTNSPEFRRLQKRIMTLENQVNSLRKKDV